MTYENVISWLEKNVPLENFDNFSEWYEASEEAVQTPALFGTSQFNRMMEDRWLNEFGTFDKSEPDDDDIPSGGITEIDTPIIEAESIITSKGTQRVERRMIVTPIGQLPRITETRSTGRSIPVIIPNTGKAPELPRPILVFPSNMPIQQKTSILSRIRRFLRI